MTGSKTNERDCPHCGSAQHHDDDFCHDCGHAFDWVSSDAEDDDPLNPRVDHCPMCEYGEIQRLDDGIRQCDRCGYTARDWPSN